MINRENELPTSPLVESTLKAIADWVNMYRDAIGLNSECGPGDVMRMAKEIGVTPSQLHELAVGPADTNLLKSMLSRCTSIRKSSLIWTR